MRYGQRSREDALYGGDQEQRSWEGRASQSPHYFLAKLQLDFKSIFEGGRRFHSSENGQQKDEINP
ncbi:ECU09_0425 [Encephalitozoon cuniculi GB-M1]|uniref:ECU09_0425 protein n=1 Tax=Encephalitozoon cuniculi (strain GB-M1) TaxID=284813 RepID=I7JU05_ENCCU|nr:uncharacterized protein ECU09_0425 [Encephalitozoon cuniculi GB-M1]UYI26722.1 hypothetical protein J0A71_03g05590 [Encephalitozoon cuniculi]CCI73974.1 ECU09_0425 [Encephalitozoon cuniculi GB-M1]